MAVPGANFGSTEQGFGRSEATKRDIAKGVENTRLTIAANEPRTAIVDGVPTGVRTKDYYGLPASVPLSEQQGATARTAMSQPGGLDAASPATRAFVGADAKTDNLYTAALPDGTTVPVTQRPDGLYHAQTGVKLPDDVSAVARLAPTDVNALKPNDPIVKELNATRTNTRIAIAQIDKIDKLLSHPDAGASVGYIGKTAGLYNGIRAQFEAAARLAGGTDLRGELTGDPSLGQSVTASVNKIFADPAFNAQAQSLGISSAILTSQISDLAYSIAKARDPSGRMSNQDVEKAAESVGASLMDPVAGRAVLAEVKNGLIQAQYIREETMKETYGTSKFPTTLNPGARPAAAPAAGVVKWGRDANGNPVRMQ